MNLKFLFWIVVFITCISSAYAVTPTHGTPLIQETTGGTETNLTFVNQSGSGTKPLIFNYATEYKSKANGTRWFNNSDCIAYYPFDQNNKSDFCRNNDLYASSGATDNVKGLVGEAMDFENAETDKLETDQDASFQFSTSFCAGAWIWKESNIASVMVIGSVGNGVAGGWMIDHHWDNSGKFRWLVYKASENPDIANSNIIPINEWHHLVGVYNEEQLRLFFYDNGNITTNVTITNTIYMTSALPFGVGGNSQIPGFDGQIDEAFIYSNTSNCESHRIKQIYEGTKSGFGIVNSSDYDGVITNYAVNMTICDSEECGATNRAPVADITPPAFTLVNLTSEGGKGYVLYNNSPEELGLLSGKARTNDTTPTFRVNTTENANCDITDNKTRATIDCTSTGTQVHTCTEDTAGFIGLNNFSINCSDSSSNTNQTDFTINITDNIAPNSSLVKPDNNNFYAVGVNNSIVFNFSATDNYDRNFTAKLYIDNTLEITNSTYLNNTNISYTITVASGSHTWFVNFTDSFNNINQSETRSFEVKATASVNITLNNTHQNKSYELNITLLDKEYGVEVNITTIPEANWSLDFDYIVNWTKGLGNTTVRFNITRLNTTKFANDNFTFNISPSIRNVSIQVDNNTDLVKIRFKLEGYEVSNLFPTNLSIDIDNDGKEDIIIQGAIKRDYVEVNEFRTSTGSNRRGANFSYATAGSQTININATSSFEPKNFTMSISGYNIDQDNLFSYVEHFNNTPQAYPMNYSMSNMTMAPIGIIEDFTTDNKRWNKNNEDYRFVVTYTNGYVEVDTSTLPETAWERIFAPNASFDIDLRNSSFISILLSRDASCGPTTSSYWTYDLSDSINKIQIFTYSCYHGTTPQSFGTYNYTLQRLGTSQNWNFSINGTTNSIVGLGALDIDKRQYPQIRLAGERGVDIARLYEVQMSGTFLNRTVGNGTFVPYGNITQCFPNAASNLNNMQLNARDYIPVNTSIKYYVSNDGTNFESINKGENHAFSTTGTRKCWRAELNSSINITTPVVRRVDIDVVGGSGGNVSIDFGQDGDVDWEWLDTLNSTNSPKWVNGSVNDFIIYKNNYCTNTLTCQYPVSLIIKSAGQIAINSLNFSQDSSQEITISNLSKLETKTYWNWTASFLNGVLAFKDLAVEYKGSKNITLFVHSIENSSLMLGSSNLTMYIYYSKFNGSLAIGQKYYNVFPISKDSKNVTPYGQTITTPIWNITNLAYDKSFDLYVKLNETQHSCLNETYSNSSNKSDGFILNTSLQLILTNISKEYYQKNRINQSINTTMNGTDKSNSTFIVPLIVDEHLTIINASEPYIRLKRNSDFRINFTSGNFTLLNATYNMTKLYASYNYSVSTPYKGIWSWWDLYNCTQRFIIKPVVFQSYCKDCVR